MDRRQTSVPQRQMLMQDTSAANFPLLTWPAGREEAPAQPCPPGGGGLANTDPGRSSSCSPQFPQGTPSPQHTHTHTQGWAQRLPGSSLALAISEGLQCPANPFLPCPPIPKASSLTGLLGQELLLLVLCLGLLDPGKLSLPTPPPSLQQ